MTVNTFDPKQTTTLETPSKIIAQQAVEQTEKKGQLNPETAARIGFVSLG